VKRFRSSNNERKSCEFFSQKEPWCDLYSWDVWYFKLLQWPHIWCVRFKVSLPRHITSLSFSTTQVQYTFADFEDYYIAFECFLNSVFFWVFLLLVCDEHNVFIHLQLIIWQHQILIYCHIFHCEILVRRLSKHSWNIYRYFQILILVGV
jgi:hypothetical protein